jgi:prepilin-type N-terminal cleavage/methylation domain-containing protein
MNKERCFSYDMKNTNGFSLVEIAVVLVIISAIIGGVLSAQTLQRSSQLQNMISEYDGYVKAFGEFQDKFHALPGDMAGTAGSTPQDYWGTDPCGCPCNVATTTKTSATCNGDGSGTIGGSTTSTMDNFSEWFRAWQHLSAAGFINGAYTGTMFITGSPREGKEGVNVPASSVKRAGWKIFYHAGDGATGLLWADQRGHVLALSGYVETLNGVNHFMGNPVLTSGEAFAVDTKMDDGKPGLGKIRAPRASTLVDCTINDTSQATQSYVTTNASRAVCNLMFLTGF